MRPSGHSSLTSRLGRLSTRSLVLGLTVAAVAVGMAGFYASRSAVDSRTAGLSLGGGPAAAQAPLQETRPAEARATSPAEARQAVPPDSQKANPADSRQAASPDARQGASTDTRLAHLRQLQPVLRTDAERLSQVARRARAEGRVTDLRKERADNAAELRALFTSHRVLSADLPNHYQEYSEAKERLRRGVAELEEEFQQTVQLVTTKLFIAAAGEPRRQEVAWAILEKCLAKGPGMTLTTRPDGYQYTVRGRSQRYSGGATVAEDEGAAFAAFTSFVPEADVVARCEGVKKRAASIVAGAEKLAAEALALAGQPALAGECKYTRAD